MHFKKMTGKNCYLSPINPEDAEKFTTWLNDPEVTRYLKTATHIISLHGEKEFLQNLAKEHVYTIVDIKTDNPIGTVGLAQMDHINRTAEIGIFIGDKNYWGKGYGTEAMSLLLDYAFKTLDLYSIFLRVYEYNERAIRSYKKIGFKQIGTRRKALRRDLKVYDIIYMDILSEDFYHTTQ
ncbi:GNAT family N-acetyltransferase [Spirochaetia bacterium 38H-sp]|uniref:GNAT family N-acetyltransferase n=1 Tax=Rarispira pelagica TaxID=3141764 RepID=A0ABU9UBJ6_9SPIR